MGPVHTLKWQLLSVFLTTFVYYSIIACTPLSDINIVVFLLYADLFLQCFNTVGWVTGRTSSPRKVFLRKTYGRAGLTWSELQKNSQVKEKPKVLDADVCRKGGLLVEKCA